MSKGKMHGIIDYEGSVVIPFEYTGFNPSYDYNVIAASDKNGKWGLIGFDNKPITPFVYDYISEFENGYATVISNGKHGLMDENGKIVVPAQYKTSEEAKNKLMK